MSIQPNDLRAGSIYMSQDGPSDITGGKLEKARDVKFPDPFPEGSNVIVIPMVQTFNGPDTPGLRITDVTPTGFKIRMNELVVSKEGHQALSEGSHDKETIGWLAIRL